MFIRNFTRLAESSFVYSSNTKLVFRVLQESSDKIMCILKVLRYIASYPVCSIGSLAFNKVSQNFTSTIACRLSPRKANGAVGDICDLGRNRWTWRICEKVLRGNDKCSYLFTYMNLFCALQ